MKIKALTVKNFRNYENESIQFGDGLNVLVGHNAQGKTNLLESIFILAIARSPRTIKDKEMLRWDSEQASVKATISKQSGDTEIELRLDRTGKKTILINDIPIRRFSEVFGVLNVIYFFPDDLKLIKEAPSSRRRFMDIDISQASRNYFFLLQRYEQILMQRNKLLKSSRSLEELKNTVSIWDEQLATVASKIILSRVKFLRGLAPIVERSHSYLTSDAEHLEISYQGITGETSQEIKDELMKLLSSNLSRDYELGYTSVGPHRDDIKILLDGVELKTYGSQGQQRTASLAMKLAEIELFRNETSEKPVLLLDDVLSELDIDRRTKLLEVARGVQTIITCTEYPYNTPNTTIFTIKSGKIIK